MSRSQPCARCSRLAREYERLDPKWMPPPAESYERNGYTYRLPNCEPCTEIEFVERWNTRMSAVEDPNEPGIRESERGVRSAKIAALSAERARFYEGKRQRYEIRKRATTCQAKSTGTG